MIGFFPEAIYERGRQETAANQPRFYDQLRKLIASGLALCLERPGGGKHWFVCAPTSRLDAGLLLAHDLAEDGADGGHRIQFDQIYFTQDTWGWLLVAGNPVADFRPISEADSREFVDLWNTRSGRPPIQLVEY
ncbi:MAG: hypothetical protein EXS35_08565 [Pedosphaera sp.]|nr:hypothetical protein [Pedosphaera sp.]